MLKSVFTTNGTLLGYSEGTTIRKGRTIAALTGAAWRINDDMILNHSKDVPYAGSFLKMVEVFPYDQADAGLKCMLAEVNEWLIAVHYIKERLLVAAMLPLNALEPPPADEHLDELRSFHVFDETKSAATDTAASAEVKEVVENIDSSSESHLSVSTESSAGSLKDKGKGKDMGSEDKKGEKAFSKKDLLMMKAEGMVDVLLNDLVEFVMPDEFY